MRIAEHFRLRELLESDHHPELAARPEELGAERALAIARTVHEGLEPPRRFYGQPLLVSSGFRPPPLNEAANGAADSRHLEGLAADFWIEDVPAARAFRDAADGRWGGFDRLALYPPSGGKIGRLHLDLRRWEQGRQRGLLYIARPGWVRLDADQARSAADEILES